MKPQPKPDSRAGPSHKRVLPSRTPRQDVKVNTPALGLCRARLHRVAGRLEDTHGAVLELLYRPFELGNAFRKHQYAPGAPLITSAGSTSRVGGTTISPDLCSPGLGTGFELSDATPRTRVGTAARPDRRANDVDWAQALSKDIICVEYAGSLYNSVQQVELDTEICTCLF
jgi:hypothetical protein